MRLGAQLAALRSATFMLEADVVLCLLSINDAVEELDSALAAAQHGHYYPMAGGVVPRLLDTLKSALPAFEHDVTGHTCAKAVLCCAPRSAAQ